MAKTYPVILQDRLDYLISRGYEIIETEELPNFTTIYLYDRPLCHVISYFKEHNKIKEDTMVRSDIEVFAKYLKKAKG